MGFTACADIGSANVRAVIPASGLRIASSSAVARYRGEKDAYCTGDEAYELIGRTGSAIQVKFPVRGTMLADRQAYTDFLADLADKAGAGKRLRRTSILLAVNSPDLAEVVAPCAYEAGFDEITAVPCDAVSALGAGYDPAGETGTFVIDMGAEHISAAIYALGRTVRRAVLPFGMNETDEAIIRKVREEKGCLIGPHTAREMKHLFLSAVRMEEITQSFAGISTAKELPVEFTMESRLIESAAEPYLRSLITLLRQTMLDLPEDICGDILQKGAVLTGGGSRIYGVAERLSERLGIAVKRTDDEYACVIDGLMLLNGDAERLSRLKIYSGSKD